MLNKEFANQVHSSDNGHIYLKVLRERVVDELGLTIEPKIEDMFFKNMTEKSKNYLKYDIDSMYNMQDVNNTQSIGYDNMDKNDGTFKNSHSDVFDKLLADYYLSLRGEYAEANKLMA